VESLPYKWPWTDTRDSHALISFRELPSKTFWRSLVIVECAGVFRNFADAMITDIK